MTTPEQTGPLPPGPSQPVHGRPDVVVHRAAARAPDADTLALLDEAERARLGRLRRADDRARFATGRRVARMALGELLGLAPGDVPLLVLPTVGSAAPERGGTGRPVVAPLEGRAAPVLSIAHAGDVVLVAIAGHGLVGVDVEGGAGGSAADEELWAEAATPDERSALRALPEADRADAFLALWTRKEAVLKACGRGLTVPMTALAVSLGRDARVLHAGPGLPAPDGTILVDLQVGPGYRAALALAPADAVEPVRGRP